MKTSFALALIACVIGLTGCKDEEAEWHAFSIQHHCKIIERQPGHTSYISSYSGNSISVIPIRNQGLTTYQCNDQVVSRRED